MTWSSWLKSNVLRKRMRRLRSSRLNVLLHTRRRRLTSLRQLPKYASLLPFALKYRLTLSLVQSVVTLEVKPWDDETDMKELEENVRAIEQDGLVWGSSKLVEVGFGIKKLQITLVIGAIRLSQFCDMKIFRVSRSQRMRKCPSMNFRRGFQKTRTTFRVQI
jgi:hypothetical protein